MKARTKPKPAAKPATERDAWRISDLPLDAQLELRAALEEARRGDGLQDFDEAIAETDALVDEMFARLDSKTP